MELDYSYQAKVSSTIRALWHYYIYIYAPRVINHLLSAGILLLVDPCISMPDGLEFMTLWCAVVLLALTVAEFPVYCYRVVKIARSSGAYDEATHIKLNEESVYIERGSDNGNTSLRSLSEYFIHQNILFLLVGGKSLVCAINLNEIPEGREKAMTIMEKSPVKKLCFVTFRRWLFTGILLILAVLIIYVRCSGIA